jgi:hypothetical protein
LKVPGPQPNQRKIPPAKNREALPCLSPCF